MIILKGFYGFNASILSLYSVFHYHLHVGVRYSHYHDLSWNTVFFTGLFIGTWERIKQCSKFVYLLISGLLTLGLSYLFTVVGRLYSVYLVSSSASSILLIVSSSVSSILLIVSPAYILGFWISFDLCMYSFVHWASDLLGAKCVYWKLIIRVGLVRIWHVKIIITSLFLLLSDFWIWYTFLAFIIIFWIVISDPWASS